MPQGEFVWYDLGTTDPAAAKAFYGTVLGWDADDIPEMHYTIFRAGETRAGGLMALPEPLRQAGVPPHWLGYIGVDDVDATAERVTAEGGQIRHAPMDIPGIGRFAVVADPQGAVFALFKGASEAPPPAPMMTPGLVAWRELITTDPAAAMRFYFGLFGWTAGDTADMGPMGIYQMFRIGDAGAGGIMRTPEGMQPGWLYYFAVDRLTDAIGRVESAGGQVVFGPQAVPGNAWIVNCRDPQGAFFALVSATK